MPKGPQGQKRPADVIGNAVHVMRIATGQIDDASPTSDKPVRGAAGGAVGGNKRAQKLSPAKRAEIAKKAAAARWGKKVKK